jgi:hypothetical protein
VRRMDLAGAVRARLGLYKNDVWWIDGREI